MHGPYVASRVRNEQERKFRGETCRGRNVHVDGANRPGGVQSRVRNVQEAKRPDRGWNVLGAKRRGSETSINHHVRVRWNFLNSHWQALIGLFRYVCQCQPTFQLCIYSNYWRMSLVYITLYRRQKYKTTKLQHHKQTKNIKETQNSNSTIIYSVWTQV